MFRLYSTLTGRGVTQMRSCDYGKYSLPVGGDHWKTRLAQSDERVDAAFGMGSHGRNTALYRSCMMKFITKMSDLRSTFKMYKEYFCTEHFCNSKIYISSGPRW